MAAIWQAWAVWQVKQARPKLSKALQKTIKGRKEDCYSHQHDTRTTVTTTRHHADSPLRTQGSESPAADQRNQSQRARKSEKARGEKRARTQDSQKGGRHGSVAALPINGLLQQPKRGDHAGDTLLLLLVHILPAGQSGQQLAMQPAQGRSFSLAGLGLLHLQHLNLQNSERTLQK